MTELHSHRDDDMTAGEREYARRKIAATEDANGPNGNKLVEWVGQHFAGIDKDNDGKLTKKEIQVAMQDKDLATANGAVYLSALHDQIGEFHKSFGDPNQSEGYTRGLLQQFAHSASDLDLMMANVQKLDLLQMRHDLNRLDTNNDGRVDLGELQKAPQRKGWSREQLARFEVAKQYYDQLLKSSEDGENYKDLTPQERDKRQKQGISKQDLEQFPDKHARESLFMENSIRWFNRRLNELHKEPDHLVSQGLNNSCFFIAPALQLQMRNPQAIKNMIHDNNDGTRTVTFPGDKEHPIIVNAPTEAELITYANHRDIATLEKAFGIYWYQRKKEEAQANKEQPPEEWPETQERLQFGNADVAVRLLTGVDTTFAKTKEKSVDELRGFLEEAQNKGRPLIVNSMDSKDNERWGLTPRHSLVVKSYDAKTQKLTLINPLWLGGGTQEPSNLDHTPADGKNDRTFQITLTDLKNRFFEVISTRD